MIVLSESYPPNQPNPHGSVLITFPAWEEIREFSREYLTWPKGSDPDEQAALLAQDYLRQFYTSRWFAESKWFRTTFKHSALVLANENGYQLRQVATRCADGVALASFSEVAGNPKYDLDDDYHSKRVIEETLVLHREAFARPSGS